MIIDTDVLIWGARGNDRACSEIQNIKSPKISCITAMELLQGARDKAEQKKFFNLLKSWNIEIVHINENISTLAMQYNRDFSLSKGIGIEDALIAATVIEKSEELFTANDKHFNYVTGLKIRKFRP